MVVVPIHTAAGEDRLRSASFPAIGASGGATRREALRVSSVDLTKRRIEVKTSFTEAEGELYEDTPKSHKTRRVPIPTSLVSELKPLIQGRDAQAYLFTTARGNPIRLRNWRRREFKVAREKAGFTDKLTPHKLRHTAASLAINVGANVYVVQRMLGHAKPSVTLDVYGHLFSDRLDEVADAIDAKRLEEVAKAA